MMGKQDIVFAGGCEEVDWTLSNLFDAMGAMSSDFNDRPSVASRAYDRDRDGFVIAGGAGILVLEDLDRAKARGAKIYAEIVGYAANADAYDMVAPSGEGASRCMKLALAGLHGKPLPPIDYLNPHGTSTVVGDAKEMEAVRAVFGDKVPLISSTKSLTGHSLGGAGAQEAIYCMIMMQGGFAAESAHIENLDPAFEGLPILRGTQGCGAEHRHVQLLRLRRHQRNLGAEPPRRLGRFPPAPLEQIGVAVQYVAQAIHKETPMADDLNLPKGELMKGKKGLVMGVANHNSIAWAIASQLAVQGAEIAFTYIEAMEKRVKPLGESIGVKVFAPCEVTDDASMDAAFKTIEEAFGTLDFVVHAIAFSDKNELKGSFVDNTTRENFARSMDISAYSFRGRRATFGQDHAQRRLADHPDLPRLGADHSQLQRHGRGQGGAGGLHPLHRPRSRPQRHPVWNAISAGAIRTLSLAGISGGRSMISQGRNWSPLREDTAPEGVAGCALWLLSDLGRSTTGEVVHVDAGFHIVGLPEGLEGEG